MKVIDSAISAQAGKVECEGPNAGAGVAEGSSLLTGMDDLTFELGGNTQAQLAAMLLQHAQAKKTQVSELKVIERQHLQERAEQQIEQLLKQANDTFAAQSRRAIGGMIAGFTQIAAGVCVTSSSEPQLMSQKMGMVTGAGAFAQNGLNLAGASSDLAASEHQTAAEVKRFEVKNSERRLDELSAEEASASELIRSALEFMQSAYDGVNQAERSAIFQRV